MTTYTGIDSHKRYSMACQMKMRTDAANAWLATALDTSSPTFVSKQAG